MVAITSDCVFYEQDTGMSKEKNSPFAMKEVMIETPATAAATNTIVMTLADYGLTTFKTIRQFRHTTANSVVVAGTAPTTSVTTGVLTITLPACVATKYVFVVGGI